MFAHRLKSFGVFLGYSTFFAVSMAGFMTWLTSQQGVTPSPLIYPRAFFAWLIMGAWAGSVMWSVSTLPSPEPLLKVASARRVVKLFALPLSLMVFLGFYELFFREFWASLILAVISTLWGWAMIWMRADRANTINYAKTRLEFSQRLYSALRALRKTGTPDSVLAILLLSIVNDWIDRKGYRHVNRTGRYSSSPDVSGEMLCLTAARTTAAAISDSGVRVSNAYQTAYAAIRAMCENPFDKEEVLALIRGVEDHAGLPVV